MVRWLHVISYLQKSQVRFLLIFFFYFFFFNFFFSTKTLDPTTSLYSSPSTEIRFICLFLLQSRIKEIHRRIAKSRFVSSSSSTDSSKLKSDLADIYLNQIFLPSLFPTRSRESTTKKKKKERKKKKKTCINDQKQEEGEKKKLKRDQR